MSFISTVPPDEATAEVATMYEADLKAQGYISNYTKGFSRRPEVMAAWRGLNKTIIGGMDHRTYELATLAAARALRSSYCSLAHGSVLASTYHSPQEVAAIAAGSDTAPLDDRDRAVMRLAAKVALDANSVGADDIEDLRRNGLTDTDVFDVVAAAAARSFFAKVVDGLGMLPDAAYHELDKALKAQLTVGRPIEPAAEPPADESPAAGRGN